MTKMQCHPITYIQTRSCYFQLYATKIYLFVCVRMTTDQKGCSHKIIFMTVFIAENYGCVSLSPTVLCRYVLDMSHTSWWVWRIYISYIFIQIFMYVAVVRIDDSLYESLTQVVQIFKALTLTVKKKQCKTLTSTYAKVFAAKRGDRIWHKF